MTKLNIAIVTATRAEYGLLKPIIQKMEKHKDFNPILLVTGTHLSQAHGITINEIKSDNVNITEKIEIPLSDNSNVGTAKTMGTVTTRFAEILDKYKLDYILLLGDRFELLSIASAALVQKIPIIHIFGGDVSEGAFDDSIRHAITKMSHLHFVSNQDSKNRVIQMGENPKHVFNVGHSGLDEIKQMKLLNKQQLSEQLNIQFRDNNILVTYHPVTLEENSAKSDVKELLSALGEINNDTTIIFTAANADPGGDIINKYLKEYSQNHDHAYYFESLGKLKYYSMLQYIDCVVGNSSSGIHEVPSFHKATVNIGDRQKNRTCADSVIHCTTQESQILSSIEQALSLDCSAISNPYEGKNVVDNILSEILKIKNPRNLLKKHFLIINCKSHD